MQSANDISYNQKEVLFKAIRRYIKTSRARSLLDIGAGSGVLAIRLAKLVPNYIAVEKNACYASNLKKAGLNVIQGNFPIKVPGEFDLVLISHSLPEKRIFYRKFLEVAWSKVKPGGTLLNHHFQGR